MDAIDLIKSLQRQACEGGGRIGVGVPLSQFNGVNGLKGSRRCRWGSTFDQHSHLRRIRHQRKLSQERLAHDAGVDRAYISRVERAVTYVGLEIIRKLADVLWVDPVEFFRRPTRSAPVRGVDPTGMP